MLFRYVVAVKETDMADRIIYILLKISLLLEYNRIYHIYYYNKNVEKYKKRFFKIEGQGS